MISKVIGMLCIVEGLCLVLWAKKELKNAPKPGTLGEFGAIICFATTVAMLMMGGIAFLLS